MLINCNFDGPGVLGTRQEACSTEAFSCCQLAYFLLEVHAGLSISFLKAEFCLLFLNYFEISHVVLQIVQLKKYHLFLRFRPLRDSTKTSTLISLESEPRLARCCSERMISMRSCRYDICICDVFRRYDSCAFPCTRSSIVSHWAIGPPYCSNSRCCRVAACRKGCSGRDR